jgi:hypothetical protein
LIVLSDHGQIDMGGHGWNDPVTLMEPFVMTGAAVIPGAYGDLKLEDIAPTLALLLGTNIPASNQGKAQSGMLDLPSELSANLPAAEKSQQDTLDAAILGAGTNEDNGKFWRGAIALVCALLPALWLIIKKKKDVWIYLGGGILYLLVYNLRYAVLQGKPYSLSPVASAGALILDTIIGTALALGTAWLLVGLLRGFFQQPAAAVQFLSHWRCRRANPARLQQLLFGIILSGAGNVRQRGGAASDGHRRAGCLAAAAPQGKACPAHPLS